MPAGRNIFLLSFLTIAVCSCQKEINFDVTGNTGGSGGGSGGSSTYPFYFIASVNGANVKYEADDLNSRYSCGISQPSNSLDPSDYDIYEGTVIADPMDMTKNTISVHILKHFDHEPSLAERSAMIRKGIYIYGKGDVSSNTVSGASIHYVDASGNDWFSETGSQAGSSFNITELVDNTTGLSGKIFKAAFSCKLYDINGANPIQVNNATIRGKILSP